MTKQQQQYHNIKVIKKLKTVCHNTVGVNTSSWHFFCLQSDDSKAMVSWVHVPSWICVMCSFTCHWDWGLLVGSGGSAEHCCCCSVSQSRQTLCNSMDYSPPYPLSMRFPRQECWSGLPLPLTGDFSDSGVESVSPAWQVDSLAQNLGS